jgi:hypothetical protein
LRATLSPRLSSLAVWLGWRTAERRKTAFSIDEVLELQQGELVEVKSLSEIMQTLDSAGKQRGLIFTPEMRKHCGRRYCVLKRLELMFDEHSREQRQVRNTVLLDGAYCEGEGIGCDRSCFLYWREAWLRRVDK